MKKLTLVEQLKKLDACSEARRWVRKRKFKTLQEAWDVCRNADWMRWLLMKAGMHCTNKYDDMRREIFYLKIFGNGGGNIIRKYYPKAPKIFS